MKRVLLLIFLLICSCPVTFAARHARKGERPPKAILVMLKTRTRQVNYMAAHKPEHLPRLRKDIQSVMRATLNDFSDHFTYCPVYFFADTMIEEVRAGHFRAALLNKDLQPANQKVLAEGDTSVFVIDFGHPASSSKKDHPEEGYVNLREVLIAMDHNFDVLEWPRPNGACGFISTSSSKYKDCWYRSDNYEIDYTPQAAAYSLTLERYYQRR